MSFDHSAMFHSFGLENYLFYSLTHIEVQQRAKQKETEDGDFDIYARWHKKVQMSLKGKRTAVIRGRARVGGVHLRQKVLKIDISRILAEVLSEESVRPLEQVRPILAWSDNLSQEVTFCGSRESGDESLGVTSSPESTRKWNHPNPGRNLFNRLRSAN